MEREPQEQGGKAWWRNPAVLLLILAVILALVAGVWFYLAWFIVKAIYIVIYGITGIFSGRWFR